MRSGSHKTAFAAFLLSGWLTAAALLPGCGGQGDTLSDNSSLTAEAFPVEVTRAAYEEVAHTLEAVGSFLPNEEAMVGSEVAGRIQNFFVDEGSKVSEGQVLLQIDEERVRLEVEETEAMLKEARARLKNSQSTLARKKSLLQNSVIDQQGYDDALTQVSLNQAAVEKLQAQLNRHKKALKDTRVLAPLSGTVSSRPVSVGEYVKVGAELVSIVDTNPLRLVFSLPEKNSGQVFENQQVEISVRAFPGETFAGRIYYLSPKVDPSTRTIEIKAWVDNSDGRLRPGFFASVNIMLAGRRSMVLPESAVLVRDGSIIAMAVERGKVVYKHVTPGFRFNGLVEILEGITTEDQIVITGRNEISQGTRVEIVPSG